MMNEMEKFRVLMRIMKPQDPNILERQNRKEKKLQQS